MTEKSNYQSIINSYWFWADPLYIIRDIPNSENWLINNFISLRGCIEDEVYKLFFFNHDYRNKMVEFYDCPFIKMEKINFGKNKSIFDIDIIDFIMRNLDEKKYVLLVADRYFIPLYSAEMSFPHQILLCGYDDYNFYFCDNDDRGKFSVQLSCEIDKMRKAILAFKSHPREPDVSESVFVFSPVVNDNYNIDFFSIKRKCIDYLKPNNFAGDYWVYGIDIYEDLINYIEQGVTVPIHTYNLLLDHKRIMQYRIERLFKDRVGYMELKEYSDDILFKTNVIQNLNLKLILSNNLKNNQLIQNHLQSIYQLEKKMMEKLISNM